MVGELEELKKKVRHGPAHVIIGKSGVSKAVLEEIKKRLKKEKVIKVKMLKSTLQAEGRDRFKIAEEVAKLTNSKLIEVRGRTFILQWLGGENVNKQ